MPTPRRKYFFVADEILREPWPRDLKLTAVLLLAALNMRRSRDGKGAQEACSAVFSRAALAEITGRAQLVHSRRALRALEELTSIEVEELGEFTRITWRKVAEFQQWHAAERPKVGRATAGPAPLPNPNSVLRHRPSNSKELEQICEVVEGGREVPDRLSDTDRERLSRWLLDNLPELWPELERLERDCLTHYRQHPERARGRRSWLAVVEGWAKVAADRRENGSGQIAGARSST